MILKQLDPSPSRATGHGSSVFEKTCLFDLCLSLSFFSSIVFVPFKCGSSLYQESLSLSNVFISKKVGVFLS